MSQLTYTLEELKEELQERSTNSTRQWIDNATTEHGFPRHLPGSKLRWSKPAVDHWFEMWDLRPDSFHSEEPTQANLQKHMEAAYGQ
jgi:hypothetical protein